MEYQLKRLYNNGGFKFNDNCFHNNPVANAINNVRVLSRKYKQFISKCDSRVVSYARRGFCSIGHWFC